MMKIVQANKEAVLEKILAGRIDDARISEPNFIETIIKKMLNMGILDGLKSFLKDKRVPNPFTKSPKELIPLELLLVLALTAKMKIKTSMSDIPYAIEDAELLAQLGFNLVYTPEGEAKKLVTEGEYRYLFEQYTKEEFVKGYNACVQQHILPKAGISSQIHILDCTKIEVNNSNTNYEGATVVRDKDGRKRGYKLGTLRGLVGDTGVIEEICFGAISEADVKLCEEMLLNSPVLKPGDIVINDRGFISREIMNRLKSERGVDVYVPVKKSMDIYTEAILLAKMADTEWVKHPNKKRKTQEIAFIGDLGSMWQSSDSKKDVPVNACVVHDRKDNKYYVFVTTDTTRTARQIILTYEIRPEIEEDYRQLKDFWCLEGFKSTKLSLITFHIVCTLLGYLMFQIYVGTEEGGKYAGKSLPVILKNWKNKTPKGSRPKSVVIYADEYFGIFPFVEFLHLYASLEHTIRAGIDPILAYA